MLNKQTFNIVKRTNQWLWENPQLIQKAITPYLETLFTLDLDNI